MSRRVHPIEAESYRRLRALVDLSGLPPLSRAVAERVIHASADLSYADDLVLDEAALRAGARALAAGAPVVVDVRMVAAGIGGVPVLCGLDLLAAGGPAPTPRLGVAGADAGGPVPTPRPGGPVPTPGPGVAAAGEPAPARGLDAPGADGAPEGGLTRSAAGLRLATGMAGPGAVYVVGCAPTALFELLDAACEPALVVGLPVGFVDAVEAKEALRHSGLPAVSNRGPKGGSAVAAATVNALVQAGVGG